MTRFVKHIVKYIAYGLINLLVSPSNLVASKSILLVRLDATGDYTLFRNFIQQIRDSKKYHGFKITLLGNDDWKDLAILLDSQYVDEFIWLDRYKFQNDLIYRYQAVKMLVAREYDTLINPVHSRDFFVMDSIVKLITAREKIGSSGDLANLTAIQKCIGDRYYTKLIPAKDYSVFEFDRNRDFFEKLLNIDLSHITPSINLSQKTHKLDLPGKYALLFIGAGDKRRKWKIEHFIEVAQHLYDKYGYEIVLCGSNSDYENASVFKNNFNEKYTDLTGKTTFFDLLIAINYSAVIISNETCVPHLAVALGTSNIFVISNGNHFGRFVPYPANITDKYYAIFHTDINYTNDSFNVLSHTYRYGSNLDINEISATNVINKIDTVLKNNNSE